ncbi:MAG: biopolymer transporter ExbD [Kiritimatiellales bacterium]
MKLKLIDDENVDIDMSPMIDMVFLLLIFFIVAAAAVDLDKPKNIEIPPASQAKVAEDVTGRLTISVAENGQLYIGAIPVTMDELKERVTEELGTDPELRLFIRADENVPYRVNKELMVACAEIGAVNLIYAAFEE